MVRHRIDGLKKKQKQHKAEKMKLRYNLKRLKVFFSRMRGVLQSEAAWLKQVRYEINVRAREQAIILWKMFVKY
jgi:hypothetical protein